MKDTRLQKTKKRNPRIIEVRRTESRLFDAFSDEIELTFQRDDSLRLEKKLCITVIYARILL